MTAPTCHPDWRNPERLPSVTPTAAFKAADAVRQHLDTLMYGRDRWPDAVPFGTELARRIDGAYDTHQLTQELAALMQATPLPQADLQALAIHLAGSRLPPAGREGKGYPPQSAGCWGLVHITDALPSTTARGKTELILRVLAGPKSGCKYILSVSRAWCSPVIRRQSKRLAIAGMQPVDMGGWCMLVWIPDSGSLSSEDCQFTASLKKWNGDLVRGRGVACCKGRFPLCFAGCPLPRTSCWLSRHTTEWTAGQCRGRVAPHQGFITPSGWCGHCLLHGSFVTETDKKDHDEHHTPT